MTRRQDTWRSLSPIARERALAVQKALALGTQALTPEERAQIDKPTVPRRRPVQHESREMQILANRVWRHWWADGFHRWEHRTTNEFESEQRRREGARTGWPDCGLFIGRPPIRAVCELKTPALAPKRRKHGDRWWLEDWPREDQQSWHGLRKDQWKWLRLLHECEFHTFVAYGADEAELFFVEVAGPMPG